MGALFNNAVFGGIGTITQTTAIATNNLLGTVYPDSSGTLPSVLFTGLIRPTVDSFDYADGQRQ